LRCRSGSGVFRLRWQRSEAETTQTDSREKRVADRSILKTKRRHGHYGDLTLKLPEIGARGDARMLNVYSDKEDARLGDSSETKLVSFKTGTFL
jgi:hypothetical protein